MWQKRHSLSVCISSTIAHIWALSQLSLCTHNPAHSLDNYFSISEQLFSLDGPSIFFGTRFTKSSGRVPIPAQEPEKDLISSEKCHLRDSKQTSEKCPCFSTSVKCYFGHFAEVSEMAFLKRKSKNLYFSEVETHFFWEMLSQRLLRKTPEMAFLKSLLHESLYIVQHAATLQHIATHCNTLHHAATRCNIETHRNTLQHAATHSNTLQHTPTHSNTLQHTPTHSNTLQHTATHCNTLQHTAAHCNTLQHTATHFNWFASTILGGDEDTSAKCFPKKKISTKSAPCWIYVKLP